MPGRVSAIAVVVLGAALAAAPLWAQGRGRGASAPEPPPPGDAGNGKALVTSSKCLDCHRIGDTGSRVGPDLTTIGVQRSPEQLIRALVAPDEEVLPENRSVRLVTSSGTTVTGRILNQDAFSIQLITGNDMLKSYQRSDLRESTILTTGLMPSYAQTLTPQQVTDIVNYLASLKGAAQ
jgi:putative heme-binding domain-containing protein